MMEYLNYEYQQQCAILHASDNYKSIKKAADDLTHLNEKLLDHYPELMDSMTDVEYELALAAFRLNNTKNLEKYLEQNLWSPRFKKLYRLYLATSMNQSVQNVLLYKSENTQKMVVRTVSVCILTAVCLAAIFRI